MMRHMTKKITLSFLAVFFSYFLLATSARAESSCELLEADKVLAEARSSREPSSWLERAFSLCKTLQSCMLSSFKSKSPFPIEQEPPRMGMADFVVRTLRHRADPLRVLESIHGKFGDRAYLKLPNGKVWYFETDPAITDAILKQTDRGGRETQFEKSMLQAHGIGKLVGANNTFLGKGVQASVRRGDFAEFFSPSYLEKNASKPMSDIIDAHITSLKERIVRDGGTSEVNLDQEMSTLTMKIILKVLFNQDISTERLIRDIGPSFQTVVRFLPLETANPFAFNFGELPNVHPAQKKLRHSYEILGGFAEELIREARLHPESSTAFMRRLLEFRNPETGESLGQKELQDEILTMLLAGHETTSTLLSWSFLHISKSSKAAAKLNSELDEFISDQLSDPAVLKKRCPYLNASLDESLRLSSPAYVIMREVKTDTNLVASNGNKVFLPAGANIILTPYITHRRSEQWSQNGEASASEFSPERWIGQVDPKTRKTFAFGAGQRTCLGINFARVESLMILSKFTHAFSIYVPDVDPGKRVSDISPRIDGGISAFISLRDKHQ